ncbi:MAG: cytochrome P460 family protein [Alphaproteobacteria bacterium]|nr:cytochrome P460 family protein [Alphaproteobacteria bacterium]
MGKNARLILIIIVVVVAAGVIYYLVGERKPPVVEAPFGRAADIAYATTAWSVLSEMSMVGPGAEVADAYPGGAPHGELLETVTRQAMIAGHDGTLIVKKNFAATGQGEDGEEGEGITPEQVAADPDAYLVAITIMFQREAGYDEANQNWFWAKYLPDGSLDQNPAGIKLAGRVGDREADVGCLGCHDDAPGEDYIFNN